MPEEAIVEKIRRVRRRLKMQRYFQTFAQFLFYGLLVCVPLFVIDSLTTFDVAPLNLLWLALGISVAALIISALRPISLYEAARTIDTVQSLKDRAVSALEFIQRPPDEPLTTLQIRDTSNHLQVIPAKQVVRYAIPRKTRFCILIMAVLLAFSYIEFFAPSVTSTEIDYSAQIAEETASLLKEIEEAGEEAKRVEDQELEEIMKKLLMEALELKKAKITPKEALAKLTELSAILESKMDSAKMAKMESLMKTLAQKFTGNPILGDFGYTLKRGEYKEAAKKLDAVKEKIEQLNQEQFDRFFFKLKVMYPNIEELDTIMERTTKREMPTVEKICGGETINELALLARDVLIAEDVRRYALQLVVGTHPESDIAPELTKKYVRYGASPRGAQTLILAGKIKAILDGRYNVAREDIQAVALPGLRHRLILNFEGEAEGVDPDQIIQHLLEIIQ